MPEFTGFGPDVLAFLAELEKNNCKEWFEANKARYEANVMEPSRAFVRAMAPRLRRISKHIVANDASVGGSRLRIHRDTRFSKDKRPYNEHVSMVFRHDEAKGRAAPGFYLRITSKGANAGTGVWQPDTASTSRIRDAIVGRGKDWTRARDEAIAAFGPLAGESLKRPPRQYDTEHPLVEDLMRKDFAAFADLPTTELLAPDFADTLTARYRASKRLLEFLCGALGLPC